MQAGVKPSWVRVEKKAAQELKVWLSVWHKVMAEQEERAKQGLVVEACGTKARPNEKWIISRMLAFLGE